MKTKKISLLVYLIIGISAGWLYWYFNSPQPPPLYEKITIKPMLQD